MPESSFTSQGFDRVSACRYTRITDQSVLTGLDYEGATAKFHFPPNYLYNVPSGISLRFVYKVKRSRTICTIM